MAKIPVTLPDGSEVVISGGGQNVLIAQIIEEFCPRLTPGGIVLCLGAWVRTGQSCISMHNLIVQSKYAQFECITMRLMAFICRIFGF